MSDYTDDLWEAWHASDAGNHIREEWEVTSSDVGPGFPPYRFVFGAPGEGRFREVGSTPESRAREFCEQVDKHGWPDPPKMRRRFVVEGGWHEVDQ